MKDRMKGRKNLGSKSRSHGPKTSISMAAKDQVILSWVGTNKRSPRFKRENIVDFFSLTTIYQHLTPGPKSLICSQFVIPGPIPDIEELQVDVTLLNVFNDQF
ncbi:hypothetical protein ACFE04_028695 [Oxalis oulophora]